MRTTKTTKVPIFRDSGPRPPQFDNAIVLAAAALAEQGLNQQQLKILTMIQNDSGRLTNMVNDILDFARGRLGVPMPITKAPSHLEPNRS